MTMTLTSPAFENHAELPSKYTCEGTGVSPPLEWSGVPAGTRSLALVVEDPDAPDPAAPLRVFTHWVLLGLPAELRSLPEAVGAGLPKGARAGRTDSRGRPEYSAPCPPIGRHRYFFKLYALDVLLSELKKPTRQELEAAMKGHVLEQAELVGTYQKKKA